MRHPSGSSTLVRRIGFLAAAALVSLSVHHPAAQQEGQAEQPPRFRVEANYVRVDAYPTRDGRPVRGLRVEDFEIFENGAPQPISAFEHVLISPAGPQSLRADPQSVRDAEQQAGNARNRVFIVFLDVPHVAVEGGHWIREPLIRLMDRTLSDDDLVAFMTPAMSAAQLTFGRKTEVVAAMLREGWTWGHRHSIRDMDDRERQYDLCYPAPVGAQRSRTAALMIARRRERMVLDALHDLVRYLGGVREERKAIVTVSEGWTLFRPDQRVTQLETDPRTGKYSEPVPGKPPIGVDEHGTLRIDPPRRGVDEMDGSRTTCDRERMHLAAIDNEDYFRQLLDVANRNNASFYPIDPRGLAAFDYPIGPAAPPPLVIDQASLRGRIDSLRTLAENTDGMAVVNSNDLEAGLRRIADDLTSYYLLGYYSTDPKLDGTYRRITVRVKQPGVEVRARRGYRAATEAEVRASAAASAAPVPDNVRSASSALAALARIRADQRFALNAVPLGGEPGTATSLLVIGEITGPLHEFAEGGTATVHTGGGETAASASIEPGQRTFVVTVPISGDAATVDVRAVVTARKPADAPLSGTARIDIDQPAPRPMLFRRGPATGNRLQPAADFRFSRTERLRLEIPLARGALPGAGRFLDRNAQPLQLPVEVSERTDDEGRRWLTADATLAPLGAGDYVVEVGFTDGGAEHTVLTAVRVTR